MKKASSASSAVQWLKKGRGSASAANAKAKRWTSEETYELVEYASKSELGSPFTEGFWKGFAPCKIKGPGSRTPNSCKLRYRSLRPYALKKGDNSSTSATSSSNLEELIDVDVTINDDKESAGNDSSTQSQQDESNTESQKVDSLGFRVTAEDVQLYLKMFADVQKLGQRPCEELARNALNLKATLDIIYKFRESETETLLDTDKKIRVLLTGSTPSQIDFAKLTTFNILNSHKCAKYYILKEMKSVPQPKPRTNKMANKSVDFYCKVLLLKKDLDLTALSTNKQFEKILEIAHLVYSDVIPGRVIAVAVTAVDINSGIIFVDMYMRKKDVEFVNCRMHLPERLFSSIAIGDVLVAQDYSPEGDLLMPCNPVSRSTKILVIKKEQFDKDGILLPLQRKHSVIMPSALRVTTISVPVYKEHQEVEIKIGSTGTHKFEIKTINVFKVVIMFQNGFEDGCNLKSLSRVNYQYAKEFYLDGNSVVGWYAELCCAPITELEFLVVNKEKEFTLKVNFVNTVN